MKNITFDINKLKHSLMSLPLVALRYHLLISLVVVSGFLIFSVISVNSIINGTQDAEYAAAQQSTVIKTRFDNATIKKINELSSREENPSLGLPTDGRRNPFRE